MGRQMTQPAPDVLAFDFPLPPAPFSAEKSVLRLRLTALACGAVRVTRTLRTAFLKQQTPLIVYNTPGRWEVRETQDAYIAVLGSLTVSVDHREGAVTFLNRGGDVLLMERDRQPCVLSETPVFKNVFGQGAAIHYSDSVDGVRASVSDYCPYQDRVAYRCKLSFTFSKGEGLYGLGSHEEGYGNLRGKTRELYQHNMKAVVPMLVSTRGWGILFNLGCFMTFHDDAEGSYLWADCADEMDYYFMAGGYPAVMKTYAALTGQTPMLPRWAFGFVQSKERYVDAAELLDVVREYRRRKVPLDTIVLDWRSWPDNLWGYKQFDAQRFPDPQALTDELHRLGAHMMISVWPSMQGDANRDRAEMLENNCMLGNGTIYNAFAPQARALYWRQAYDGLMRHGIDAWWCDCSEPFESDWHGSIKPEPFERAGMNLAEAKKYLDPGQINLYSLYHAQGIYEGQRRDVPEKRVVNLTRSSYAGQHRYATITWSGDVSSSWEVLRRQVPEGLNFCASGENYWTCDAGGFFPMGYKGAWFGTGDFDKGVDDLGYRELFVRWLQLTAFLPMMRAHGTGTPREIWRFGDQGDRWYDAIEKIICLRMQLLPYLYSLSALCTASGLPMVRVPALVYPDDPSLCAVDNEMLLGDCLLVKPVTHPMQYGPNSMRIFPADETEPVYLPAGHLWYPWDGGCRYDGGQTVSVPAPLDKVPLFVRAGAILPTGPVQQYANEDPNPPLTLTIYPGESGCFSLYDDAGDGYGYEAGESAVIRVTWDDHDSRLTLSARKGNYPGMPAERRIFARLAGGTEKSLIYTGQEQQLAL